MTLSDSPTLAAPLSAAPGVADHAPSPILTVDELAELFRVERKTVYAAIALGEIPGVRRIGSIIRASREAVLGWLAQGRGRGSHSRR
jgi:excisionase family DNA binding protein